MLEHTRGPLASWRLNHFHRRKSLFSTTRQHNVLLWHVPPKNLSQAGQHHIFHIQAVVILSAHSATQMHQPCTKTKIISQSAITSFKHNVMSFLPQTKQKVGMKSLHVEITAYPPDVAFTTLISNLFSSQLFSALILLFVRDCWQKAHFSFLSQAVLKSDTNNDRSSHSSPSLPSSPTSFSAELILPSSFSLCTSVAKRASRFSMLGPRCTSKRPGILWTSQSQPWSSWSWSLRSVRSDQSADQTTLWLLHWLVCFILINPKI